MSVFVDLPGPEVDAARIGQNRAARARRGLMRAAGLPLLSLLAFFAVWQFAAASGVWNQTFVPYPSTVWRALVEGRVDNLEIYPNLWAGVGLVRGGAGTALVGSHEEVAKLIVEYHSAGFDEFLLSGYPHLEEAYWFAEGVLPILRAKGVTEQ